MPDEQRQRTYTVLRTVTLLLCAGLLYAFFFRKTGLAVPCPVFRLTGFKCPGCGVSRMCLALLHGDFAEAFRQNRAVLLLTPAFLYIAVSFAVGYIRRGDRLLHGSAKWCAYAAAALLILFGGVRNFLGW